MKIHTTIGLYPNGDYKINGVKSENLNIHIEYNKIFRPGRALFVDGDLHYKGLGISDIELIEFKNKIKGDNNFIMEKDTLPYV